MAKLHALTKPFVLLCEGQHDSQFFEHLISNRGVTTPFDICSFGYVLGSAHGGNSKLKDSLDALVSIPGFSNVQKVLVALDNDLDPVAAFANAVAQINATADILSPTLHRYVAPAAPQAKAGADPALVVLMLPQSGVAGSLDTMCLNAAARANPVISGCVDTFANCAGSSAWPITKLAKMKLRSVISASWRDDPNISSSYVWSKRTNIVPLADTEFDAIATFLTAFQGM